MDIDTDTPYLHFSMNKWWAFFPLTCHLLETHIMPSTFYFRFPFFFLGSLAINFPLLALFGFNRCWRGRKDNLRNFCKFHPQFSHNAGSHLAEMELGWQLGNHLHCSTLGRNFSFVCHLKKFNFLWLAKENRISHWRRLQWKVIPRNWVLQIQCKWTRRHTQLLQLGARSLSAS